MISALNSSSTLTARFQLNRNQQSLADSLRKLATGKKINSGKDGPAALISAERLSAEIKALEAENRSLERANANANVTDAQVGQLSSMMSEMRGLVVASANTGALSDAEIAANQMAIDNLASSIERVAGDALGSSGGFSLPDGGSADLEAELAAARDAAGTLSSGGANSLASGHFEDALSALDAGLTSVLNVRGRIGAYQGNTVETQIRSNEVALTNLYDSRSRLADTDFAGETSNLSRAETLTAAGVKVLKIAQDQAGTLLDLFG